MSIAAVRYSLFSQFKLLKWKGFSVDDTVRHYPSLESMP